MGQKRKAIPKSRVELAKATKRKAIKVIGSGGSRKGEKLTIKAAARSNYGGSENSLDSPHSSKTSEQSHFGANLTLYRCLFCPFESLEKEKWNSHKEFHTRPNKNEGGFESCPFCNFTVKSNCNKFSIFLHISGHYKNCASSSDALVFSPICPQPCNPPPLAPKNDLVCDFCDRLLETKDLLTNHKLSHTFFNGNFQFVSQMLKEKKIEKPALDTASTVDRSRESSAFSAASSGVADCLNQILDSVTEQRKPNLEAICDEFAGLKQFMLKYTNSIDEFDKRSIEIFMNCKFGPDWKFESDEFLKKIVVADAGEEIHLLLDFRSGEWGLY